MDHICRFITYDYQFQFLKLVVYSKGFTSTLTSFSTEEPSPVLLWSPPETSATAESSSMFLQDVALLKKRQLQSLVNETLAFKQIIIINNKTVSKSKN